MSGTGADQELLERFEREILGQMPHARDGRIVNATPLVDLTADLRRCAKELYKLDISNLDLRVYGKFDAGLPGGSIKARPAVHIAHEAIRTGKLAGGQTIIEATSGNFGIALGRMSRLGLTVIALVSRKLQEGVFEELRNENIRIMDMDMDICPAPGMKDADADMLKAKAAAGNVRSQLAGLGYDPQVFDGSAADIERLLAAQDIIGLAKLLGRIYGFFCPEQYDNELNICAHRDVTAVEIEQQLAGEDDSLERYDIMCAFGTGGTSGGLARYMDEKYGRKAVHVVFPVPGQDVAGIRTKANADGLGLYRPGEYSAEHEVDFGQARHLLKFFVDAGHNIGESTALALYSVLEIISDGGGCGRYVVMVADGIEKYRKSLEAMSKPGHQIQVSLDEASASAQDYDRIIWVHTSYTPKEEGIEMIARSLGVDREKISVPKASTVDRLLSTQQVPEELGKELGGKSLLICMAGNTSLMTAQVLASKGIETESLNGGITGLPEGQGKNPGQYIRAATE